IQEEIALLKAAAPHLREIVVVGLDAGLRRIEILNQKWEDIDFHHRVLYVSHGKVVESENREIPLTTRVFELLAARRKDQGLVFTLNNQPLHRVKTAWRGALTRAGIRRLRLRDLRHTFNNRLIFCGVDREVRKSLMGHAGNETHDIYINIGLALKI